LQDVAKKFETSVEALKRENGLTHDRLNQGQRIRIPYVTPGSAFLPPNGKKEKPPTGTKKETPRLKEVQPPNANPKISIPLIWPVENATVSSGFGIRKNGKHDGIDLPAPEGAKIMAAADGTVIFSGDGPTGYGKIVVVKHSESVVTIYAHNSKNVAEKGRAVKQGETIALVGHSGRATTSHCHFEVRINRVARDPQEYLPKR
jgi:murein DD-endopeptidase MepM/ murein hydrolase activator NlpD